MKTKITKRVDFHAAHRLSNHEGLCYNLHGHTYVLDVTVTKDKLKSEGAEKGMVIDFYNLKKILQDKIVSEFDHAVIVTSNYEDEVDKNLWKFVVENDLKMVDIYRRTTSENIARHIFNLLKYECGFGNNLVSVKLYETDTSFVEVTNE